MNCISSPATASRECGGERFAGLMIVDDERIGQAALAVADILGTDHLREWTRARSVPVQRVRCRDTLSINEYIERRSPF